MPKVNIIEKTRVSWDTQTGSESNYPGDENIKIGCLQRIADATEAMAKYHVQIIKDRDMYESWYRDRCKKVHLLEKSNAALRGHIKRLKRLLKEKS